MDSARALVGLDCLSWMTLDDVGVVEELTCRKCVLQTKVR